LAAVEAPALAHVETWLFDLDNTLYPSTCDLFVQIDRRMGEFISDFLGVDRDEARRVQKSYFHAYGTTMRGLMSEYGVDPEVFLDYVHRIDHSPIPPDPALEAALGRLAGTKVVFTNASAWHADRVMARLGIGHHFAAVFDIAAADYLPKPHRASYERVLSETGARPESTALIDDIPKNLEPAAALGMTTVWLRSDTEYARVGDSSGPHIHHVADDLTGWLEGVAAARERAAEGG